MNRLLFLIIAVVITCCKKEDDLLSRRFKGETTAIKNSSASTGAAIVWFGKTAAIPSNDIENCGNCVDMGFVKGNDPGILTEMISFANIPLEIKKFTLNPYEGQTENKYMCSFSTFTMGGEQGTGYYKVLGGNAEDFIEITELDMARGKFSGNYQATLVRDTNWLVEYPPDTIWITEGKFTATIGE